MFKATLEVLKLSNNKISSIDHVKLLAGLDKMIHLDLSNNEVCQLDGYRDKVYEALPNLQILDGKTRDGESYLSLDGEEDYGEEGEFDTENDLRMQEIIEKLDPETRKRFEDGEIGIEDLKGLGLIPDDFDIDSYGGYGSEEGEAENEESQETGVKRQKKGEEEDD